MFRKICNAKFHQNLFIRFSSLFHVYGQTDGTILFGASQGYEGVSNVRGCGAASCGITFVYRELRSGSLEVERGHTDGIVVA
jgi:hypothetical protein